MIKPFKVRGRLCLIALLVFLAPWLAFLPTQVGAARKTASTASRSPDLQGFHLISEREGWLLADQRLHWTTTGGQKWEDVTPMDLGPSAIRAVEFLDPRHGWLVLTQTGESNSLTYSIAKTSDGGNAWQTQQLSLFEAGDPSALAGSVSLYFLDLQTGWLVIKRTTGSNFSLGTLFTTTDGGDTWTRLTLPIGEPVYFATAEAGWTAGGANGGELYHTQDGGHTWQLQVIDSPSTCIGRRLIYRLPVFDNPREGVLPITLVCGEETQVEFYVTSDGGQSWNLAAGAPVSGPAVLGDHVPLSVIDSRTWLLSIPNSQRLLRLSASGEVTFIASQSPQASGIYELDMATANSGWAKYMSGSCRSAPLPGGDQPPPVAISACRLDTQLLRTDDGGRTWAALPLPDLNPLASAAYPASLEAVADTAGSIRVLGRTEPFVGQGFDKCEIATLGQLQTWKASSPYGAVNLYIGGSCRACSNLGLTADLVSQANQQGWTFIPTWVGPQSACYGGGCGIISNDLVIAYDQGVSEANAAISAAIDLGLALPDGSGTVIYYDLEAYGGTDPTCRNAAKAFMSGWTARLHEVGSESGVYGSGCSSALGDFANIDNVPGAAWPADWIYNTYNPDATVWGVSCLSDGLWANHQRIRQYTGGHNETWGGVTLNIDCNAIDGIVANPSNGNCCGCGKGTSMGLTSQSSMGHAGAALTSYPSTPASSCAESIPEALLAQPDAGSEAVDAPEIPVGIGSHISREIEPTSITIHRDPVEAQRTPPASENYRITKSVFGSGGGEKTSTHYVMNSTQGQGTDLSQRQSASYVLAPGYWGQWTPLVFDHTVYLPLVVRNH